MRERIKALRQQIAQFKTETRAMLDKVEAEKRGFTEAEKADFETRLKKYEGLSDELYRIERVDDLDRGQDTRSGFDGRTWLRGALGSPAPVNPHCFGLETRMADVVTDDRYANLERPLSIGKIVKGVATGDWKDADLEHRSLTISGSAGVTVPTPNSTEILDLARNKSRVQQAGARTIPMPSSTYKMVRVTGDGSVGWRAENAAFASSDMTFEAVTFAAKMIGGIDKISIELAEDAQGLDQAINDSLSSRIALALDLAALRGSGVGAEPQGIKGAAGVQTMAAVGALGTVKYKPFSTAVQKVREANGEPTGILIAPRTAGELDRLQDLNEAPLQPPPSLQKLPFYATNQIPVNMGVGVNESEAYVADWSQVMIGIRTNLMLEVSRQAADATNGAFSHGQVWIRAYLRGDIQIARPSHIVYLSGITPTA